MAWTVETEQSLDPQGLVKGKTLNDLFARYRDEISPSKKSYRSEYNRLNKLSRDPLAQMLLVDVCQHHFDECILQSLKILKSSSVNRDLNLLSSVFEQGNAGAIRPITLFVVSSGLKILFQETAVLVSKKSAQF